MLLGEQMQHLTLPVRWLPDLAQAQQHMALVDEERRHNAMVPFKTKANC
jgi:hypothetical protein